LTDGARNFVYAAAVTSFLPTCGWRRQMENVSQFADHQFNTPFADLDNKQSWVGAGEMPPSLGRFKRKYLPT
jgi:hypothetical protein